MTDIENKFSKTESIKRFSWILFDDINRRFNILIEECAHLQEIINYYSDFDINHDEKRIEINYSWQPKIKTKQRTWTAKLKENEHFEYIKLPPIERSLVALYEHLGGINKGLESHKKNVRIRFEKILKNPNGTDNFFWFSSLRGFYLHNILEKEMEHLEHAHEKLIQILETKPGALPNPILLRRWNSALHGRFLSEYSRHIDWETSKLINSLKKKKLSDDILQKERKKERNILLFILGHIPQQAWRIVSLKNRLMRKS